VNSGEGRLLYNDWEVVPRVGIVEVFVRDSSSGVSDWGADLKISAWGVVDKNWIVVHGLIIKEV